MRAWFVGRLDEKISSHEGRAGRKFELCYQTWLERDARNIRDYIGRRIRHTGSWNLLQTPELKRRYPHIDRQAGDW